MTDLGVLIQRSAELKRDLVGFACSPRLAWYYEREPRPGVSVMGARLAELVLDG